jgi:hypothetical protein
MKVELLLNGCNGQVLPISEGNHGESSQFKPCKGINLTTWHPRARRAPRAATVHDAVKELGGSYLTLVPSSTHMPRRTHRGWPKHYPIVHLWSEVRYRQTRWHMKLLNLQDSRMRQYIIKLAYQSQTINPSSTQAGATTLELWICDPDHYQPSHLVFSTFP